MKEKYRYKDGKINVDDSRVIGCALSYNYQDNIDEILKTENMIEYLEKSLRIINQDIFSTEEKIEKNKKTKKNLNIIQICLSILYLLMAPTNFFITTIIFGLLFTISLIPDIATSTSNDILSKILNGNNLEAMVINEEIIKYKSKLKHLLKDKRKTLEKIKEIENKVNIVEYREDLKYIRAYLKACFELGTNINEYEKYYNKGILDSKLENTLDKQEIKLVKKYFENNKKIS